MKLFLILLIFSFIPHQSWAKKLYKYKDEQNRWYYSDKPPNTKQKVEVRQLKAAPKRHVWLEKTGEKRKPEYFAINNFYGPVEVEVAFTEKNNVYSKPDLPQRFTVLPGKSKTLFQMGAINEYSSWQFSIQYRYTIGNPLVNYESSATYLPPFAKNSKFFISQAFNGYFSHTDKQNQYAVDIVMPIDTPVHAARSGVVIEVDNDYFNSGTNKAYKSRANSIRIIHADGSMAIYAHLALEKAQVYPGLKVSAGQLIGYSGNTGFSSGPHLHFAVQINQGMELVSVPFKFIRFNGNAMEPVEKTWLQN